MKIRLGFSTFFMVLACMVLVPVRDACAQNNRHRRPVGEVLEPIVGGEDTKIEQVPWQVLVGGGCGGSIISEQWVVSAAHCEIKIGDFVRAGITSITDGGLRRRVVEVITHPKWDGETSHGSDIALLRLSEPLIFSDKVQPIRYALPQDEAAGLMAPCVSGWVSGWGRLKSGGDTPDHLQAVKVPIVSNALADKAYASMSSTDEYEPGWMTPDQLAAGDHAAQGCDAGDGDGGEDACQGDSGGPFVVPDPTGDGYLLAGIVSWGFGCAREDLPGLYGRVSSFSKFIEDNTSVSNNRYPGLIISEIVSGTNAGGTPKYLEIHNAHKTQAYSLDNISIRVYSGGGTVFNEFSFPSGGTLAPGEVFVIAGTGSWSQDWGGDFATEVPDEVSAMIDGDGDDAYILYDKSAGFILDAYGEIGENGSGRYWDYTRARVLRNEWAVKGNDGNFSEESFGDWSVSPYSNATASPGSHTAAQGAADAAVILVSEPFDGGEVISCNPAYGILPKVQIKNMGTANIDNITLGFFNGTVTVEETFDFDSPLRPKAVLTLEPTRSIGYDGIGENRNLTVSIKAVNGQADANPVNNIRSIDFKIVQGYRTTFGITLDENPGENSWFIEQGSNKVHHGNGGNLYEGNSGETITEQVCLKEGYYDLVFLDGYFTPFGFQPEEGFLPPGNFNFIINSVDAGDVEVADVSGEFKGILRFPFKLPFENAIDLGISLSGEEGDFDGCASSQVVSVKVTNTNSLPITSYRLSYGLSGEGSEMYMSEKGKLSSGQSDNVNLRFNALENGQNDFTIKIVEVNGRKEDMDTENNQLEGTLQVDLSSSLASVDVKIDSDDFPEETSWEITDKEGTVLASVGDGEYRGLSSQLIFSNVCLPEGCYTFTIRDSYDPPDGGAGAFLTNEGGGELASVPKEDWGGEAQRRFCLVAAPYGLYGMFSSPDQIELHWTDNSDIEDGYSIERASVARGPWSKIASLPKDGQAYTDKDLGGRHHYFYRVSAYSGSTVSAYSTVEVVELSEINQGDIQLYPNPVSEGFTIIEWPVAIDKYAISVLLYDMKSNTSFPLGVELNRNKIKLNIGGLAKGMYLLKVEVGQWQVHRKLLIH